MLVKATLKLKTNKFLLDIESSNGYTYPAKITSKILLFPPGVLPKFYGTDAYIAGTPNFYFQYLNNGGIISAQGSTKNLGVKQKLGNFISTLLRRLLLNIVSDNVSLQKLLTPLDGDTAQYVCTDASGNASLVNCLVICPYEGDCTFASNEDCVELADRLSQQSSSNLSVYSVIYAALYCIQKQLNEALDSFEYQIVYNYGELQVNRYIASRLKTMLTAIDNNYNTKYATDDNENKAYPLDFMVAFFKKYYNNLVSLYEINGEPYLNTGYIGSKYIFENFDYVRVISPFAINDTLYSLAPADWFVSQDIDILAFSEVKAEGVYDNTLQQNQVSYTEITIYDAILYVNDNVDLNQEFTFYLFDFDSGTYIEFTGVLIEPYNITYTEPTSDKQLVYGVNKIEMALNPSIPNFESEWATLLLSVVYDGMARKYTDIIREACDGSPIFSPAHNTGITIAVPYLLALPQGGISLSPIEVKTNPLAYSYTAYAYYSGYDYVKLNLDLQISGNGFNYKLLGLSGEINTSAPQLVDPSLSQGAIEDIFHPPDDIQNILDAIQIYNPYSS